eukprot:CAMPEP_0196658064 /NCGR_PEP_ID=MMETSP1086-20130531/27027_1 /TAXON_ID=77921 /ORGANISM="Cyanoptyche  gloeocystis , Strain SAG4.97" /LENGTH=43 /DNA_ID= /DNA_START= /DNA_END= /DNA_ORIENTATION=
MNGAVTPQHRSQDSETGAYRCPYGGRPAAAVGGIQRKHAERQG